MKKSICLLMAFLLVISFAGCGAKMSDKQNLACDMADLSVEQWFDELGAENATVKTERKMIGEYAIYIINIKCMVSSVPEEIVEIFQGSVVDDAKTFVSPADVYVVTYICNEEGEEEYRLVDNDLPVSAASKLD